METGYTWPQLYIIYYLLLLLFSLFIRLGSSKKSDRALVTHTFILKFYIKSYVHGYSSCVSSVCSCMKDPFHILHISLCSAFFPRLIVCISSHVFLYWTLARSFHSKCISWFLSRHACSSCASLKTFSPMFWNRCCTMWSRFPFHPLHGLLCDT